MTQQKRTATFKESTWIDKTKFNFRIDIKGTLTLIFIITTYNCNIIQI